MAESCAPSLLPTGIESESPNAIDQVLARGWVMVSTDYTGLGSAGPHAYLVGEQAGRAVLDSVRAARQLAELDLEDRSVVWGHSQGGGGALWTGVLASTYAPDTNVIGVAALSPASDLPALLENLGVVRGGDIFASYVITGYSETYPDVRFTDYVGPTAQLRYVRSRADASPARRSYRRSRPSCSTVPSGRVTRRPVPRRSGWPRTCPRGTSRRRSWWPRATWSARPAGRPGGLVQARL